MNREVKFSGIDHVINEFNCEYIFDNSYLNEIIQNISNTLHIDKRNIMATRQIGSNDIFFCIGFPYGTEESAYQNENVKIIDYKFQKEYINRWISEIRTIININGVDLCIKMNTITIIHLFNSCSLPEELLGWFNYE